MFNRIIAAACAVLLILSANGYAQESLKFSVTFVGDEDKKLPLLNKATDMLKEEFESKGAVISYKEGFVFLLDIQRIKDSDQLVLSITTLNKLPRKIVEMGGRGQVFYSAIQQNGIQMLSEGSDQIREEMTMGYLNQFVQIMDSELIITQEEDLKSELSDFVRSFAPVGR